MYFSAFEASYLVVCQGIGLSGNASFIPCFATGAVGHGWRQGTCTKVQRHLLRVALHLPIKCHVRIAIGNVPVPHLLRISNKFQIGLYRSGSHLQMS